MPKLNFKQLILSTTLSLSLASYAFSDKVVASVGNEPILQSQVDSFLKSHGKPITPATRKQVLNDVIDEAIIAQALEKANIRIDESRIKGILNEEVERQMQYIAQQNGLSYGGFIIALTNQGINLEQYKQQLAKAIEPQLKQQILISALRDLVIKDEINNVRKSISHEEIANLAKKLEAQDRKDGKSTVVIKKEYNVRHILLTLNPLLNDSQARSELNTIRSQILAKKITFADAALKYSKDYLSGADGGSLGYKLPDIYDPTFAQKIKETPIGKISMPFKTQFGWHILQVEGVRNKNVTQESYMDYAFQMLMRKKLAKIEKDWFKTLRSVSDVQIVK